MVGILLLWALAVSQASTGSQNTDDWPVTRAGRVLSTPDWSDYRIYPKAALKKEQQGRVKAELRIGIDGRPTACRIVLTSYFAELDAGVCELMMKMQFEPARDAAGTPIESVYSRPTIWRLTDEQPFASGTLRARVAVENGGVRQCDFEGGDGPYVALWSSFACTIFTDTSYYFGSRKNSVNAVVEVRLNAGDNAIFLQQPWRAGTPLASEKMAFTIDSSGDATDCVPLESHGFGERGLNNLSPCGRLLSAIWFAQPENPEIPRKGVFETRVIAIDRP